MFQTRITQLFGIKYPIIQGGMMHLSTPELVAAVSNAGGLGLMPAAMFAKTLELRQYIRKIRQLTDKPFGINLTLFLHPRDTSIEDYIEVILEEGVKVVETAGRNPEPYMKRLKDGGVKVIHKTPAVRFARTAERAGVDAVAILGFEGAGHPGMDEVTSFVLIPQAARALKIPVVAAGGIGDARGFVAALALGAEGVLMGTRFAATQEAPAHPKIKEWIVQAAETQTTLVERSHSNPMRAARNKVAEKVLEMEKEGRTAEEILPFIRGDLGRSAWLEGDFDAGVVSVGQVVGLIQSIPTVKELIEGIISEAQALVGRLHTLA